MIKITAVRRHILRLNCTRCDFWCLVRLRLSWSLALSEKVTVTTQELSENSAMTARLKTRDLTSRDWTTLDHTASVDISKLISVFD